MSGSWVRTPGSARAQKRIRELVISEKRGNESPAFTLKQYAHEYRGCKPRRRSGSQPSSTENSPVTGVASVGGETTSV